MIGKFELTIGGIQVKRVSRMQVYKFPRSENKTESFAGTACVDRSALKYRLIANVALCSAAEMHALVNAASNITVPVMFYDGDTQVTATMIFDMPDVPIPFLKYGDRSKGVYYTDLTLNLEEV